MIERMNNPKPKIFKKGGEPTLDRKGRINENIYELYPGLYSTVKNRKENGPGEYEKNREITDKVARIFKEFEHKRAPQFASKSQSPYLLANSFNFDVTEILAEVKAARDV